MEWISELELNEIERQLVRVEGRLRDPTADRTVAVDASLLRRMVEQLRYVQVNDVLIDYDG